MRRFLDLVVRFRRDEGGMFAVIFGLTAIVLVALSGAVVDYVGIEQARSRGQIALDAAALALQPKIFNASISDASIKADALALLRDRLGANSGVTVKDDLFVRRNTEEGTLYLRANMSMPTIFVALVGVPTLPAQIESEASRKKLELEVAFVLDNSGSMSYTGAGTSGTRQRIQFLKDAAKCAVNIMFYKDVVNSGDTCLPASGATVLDDVKIGIVPFNMMVNVGTGNASASWMDRTGGSITSNDNFNNETGTPATVNRFALFNTVGEAWRGCVEARPHIKSGSLATEYLDTDDTLPASGNTLFVPMFSPDMVDGVGGNNYLADSPAVCDRPTNGGANCTVTRRRTSCNATMSNSSCTETIVSANLTQGSTNFTSTQKIAAGYYYGGHPPSCDCSTRTNNTWSLTAGGSTTNNRTYETTYSCQGGGYQPTGLSNRLLQERLCKYHGPIGSTNFSRGPNADCVRSAILPLSDSPSVVTTTINGMVAEGGTNIHEGTAWGFRVLSPTLPFDQAGLYNEARSKIMILMTDGENTAYNLSAHCGSTQRSLNGNCYNSAYGFPFNSLNTDSASTSGGNIERLGKPGGGSGAVAASNATLVTEMNNRLSQTCENAKAKGIVVYVVGLATADASQSTQAVVENLLQNCASTRDKAYFPQEPAELKGVFQAIANDLTALRLVR